MNGDDFKPIILNPKKDKPVNVIAPKAPLAQVNGTVNTVKKVVNDDGETEFIPVKVDMKFGQQMQQSRCAMKLTQKQLAGAVALPVSVINEYEKGTGVQNGQYVDKIKRFLKIDKNTK